MARYQSWTQWCYVGIIPSLCLVHQLRQEYHDVTHGASSEGWVLAVGQCAQPSYTKEATARAPKFLSLASHACTPSTASKMEQVTKE